MKRKLLFIASIVLCLSLLTVGTLAYYSGTTTAHNVITSSGIDITLVDSIEGGTALTDEDGVSTGWSLGGVMPGQTVTKTVAVKNTGESEAWVRLKVTLTITDANGEPLDNVLELGDKKITMVSFALDSDKWLQKDGYIYCLAPVAADGQTADLFKDNAVTFAPEMTNAYQGCHVSIQIDAQAVQTAHNPENRAEHATPVLAAAGWPES